MPAWSTEIANEFIRLAAGDGRAFDQMQLQELVYIAHGWCLAITGEPLTGDRPEALRYGPEYRRLAQALAEYGSDPVTREISKRQLYPELAWSNPIAPALADLDSVEQDVVAKIYHRFGALNASRLAALTRRKGTPWDEVFAGGAGEFQDIPHELIRAQFVRLAAPSRN